MDRVDVSGSNEAADDRAMRMPEVSETVPRTAAAATQADLDRIIDQLVTGLTRAIERADHSAASRATAFHVLTGWLRTNRHRLSDPAKADSAETLIRSALHPTGSTPETQSDVTVAATAAEQLAATLGDDFPMAIVWIAAGLDAQLE